MDDEPGFLREFIDNIVAAVMLFGCLTIVALVLALILGLIGLLT